MCFLPGRLLVTASVFVSCRIHRTRPQPAFSGIRAAVDSRWTKVAFWWHWRGQKFTAEIVYGWPDEGRLRTGVPGANRSFAENVERLLTKWYEGKSCAICTRALSIRLAPQRLA